MDNNEKRLSVRLEDELLSDFKLLCKSRCVSASQKLREWILKYLETNSEKLEAAKKKQRDNFKLDVSVSELMRESREKMNVGAIKGD